MMPKILITCLTDAREAMAHIEQHCSAAVEHFNEAQREHGIRLLVKMERAFERTVAKGEKALGATDEELAEIIRQLDEEEFRAVLEEAGVPIGKNAEGQTVLTIAGKEVPEGDLLPLHPFKAFTPEELVRVRSAMPIPDGTCATCLRPGEPGDAQHPDALVDLIPPPPINTEPVVDPAATTTHTEATPVADANAGMVAGAVTEAVPMGDAQAASAVAERADGEPATPAPEPTAGA